MCEGIYSATSNNMKLVHWPLMGGLLHLVQRGGDWAGPQPAQAPSCCTAHPSTANVPITVLSVALRSILRQFVCTYFATKQRLHNANTQLRVSDYNRRVGSVLSARCHVGLSVHYSVCRPCLVLCSGVGVAITCSMNKGNRISNGEAVISIILISST